MKNFASFGTLFAAMVALARRIFIPRSKRAATGMIGIIQFIATKTESELRGDKRTSDYTSA